MKGLFRCVVATLLVGGWALAGAAVHVVRLPDAVGSKVRVRGVVVTKDHLGYGDTYVDTRHWTAEDAAKHAEVTRKLIEAGKAGSLAQVAGVQVELAK